jgi:hypothetical protein
MNVRIKPYNRQVPALLVLLILSSCGKQKTDNIILPPVTAPLSRTVIGYGVINVSYTQLKTEPVEEGGSHGYMRRGSVVRILERRVIKTEDSIERWVLAEGSYQGWLQEEIVDIYDNELQAHTASEAMIQ